MLLRIIVRACLWVACLSIPIADASSQIVFSGDTIYEANSGGRIETIAKVPGASFNCSSCSRLHPTSMHIPRSHDDVLLTTKALIVVTNSSLKQALTLPIDCPPYYLGPFDPRSNSFQVFCKPSAKDQWRPKCVPIVLNLELSSYSVLQTQYVYGPSDSAWFPSASNSALLRDGVGDEYLVGISGDTLSYLNVFDQTPSEVYPLPDCANFSSVDPLEPAGGKFRFAVDCTRDGVKRRFIVGQEGVVEELPTPLVCDSPLVSVPGGPYGITFCGPSTLYIVNLTAGTSKYVVRGGIPAGDHVLVFPSSRHAVIGTANQKAVLLDLDAAYQTKGEGLTTVLPNTSTVYPRTIIAANGDDGTFLACPAAGAGQNVCHLFRVGQSAPVTTYNLGTIAPDAVIMGRTYSVVDPTVNDPLNFSPSNATPVITLKNRWIIAAAIVSVIVMVGVPVVGVLVYICHRNRTRKNHMCVPVKETNGGQFVRDIVGCDSSKRSSLSGSSTGDGSTGDGSSAIFQAANSRTIITVTTATQ